LPPARAGVLRHDRRGDVVPKDMHTAIEYTELRAAHYVTDLK